MRIVFTTTLLAAALCISSRADTEAVLRTDQLPEAGKTLVWSPLFQASWDVLNSRRQGKLVKVAPANDLMTHLDSFSWKEAEVMPEGGYAVFAGPATAEFANDVRNRVMKQFKFAMAESELPNSARGDAAFGVMIRDLNFKQNFYRSRKSPLDFKDNTGKVHKVAFFGTAGNHSSRFGNNVKVLSYEERGKSFILSIATDKDGERLIIYRPDRALSFDMAIEHVTEAIKAPLSGPTGSLSDGQLHQKDTLKIPHLNINSNTDFTDQLQGLRYYSGEPEPWFIAKACQITNFELFEKGAKVRVQTQSQMDPFGGEPPKPKKIIYLPRQFICDQAFFVFTWKDKSPLPYFATWVDSGDVMEKFAK
ncbi:hypothetical protein NT6N_07740 [Oceaniferula spumae]|uniref:DUF3471 domain-containing protein n=1 Tax=Oceaniferula spumae TaxID=2979115 RepID=A0AAT9FID9_9BACT